MFNPIRLVDDNFNDRDLSNANLRSFTEDHLVRLSNAGNNPGGIYNTLITDTTTRYNNYYGKMSSEAVKKAIAEGTTITRNNARKAAENKISSLQGLVKFKFGEDSPTYQEFYPQGMEDYLRAREGDVGLLFDRFIDAATTHLNADYPAEVTAITALVAAFDTAYTARETIITEVKNVQTGKHEDRKLLTVQLTKNFLTIAINNIENFDRFNDYYDPRFLPIEKDNGIRNGNVPGGNVVNIPVSGLTIHEDTEIKLKNTGDVNLRFYFAAAPNAAPATYIEVPFGGEIETTAGALDYTPTNKFLNVFNPEAPGGEYRVEINL